MKRRLTQMDPGAFLKLVARCGLDLQEVDLAQLARRKLVAPWEPDGEESCYTELHLYVVAEYLEAVRPARHPWGTRTAERTVDEIAGLTEEVNRLLEMAFSAGPASPGQRFEEFLVGLERFLARINPFGPMTEVFDLLRPEVVEQMRNGGRLYLEVKAGADELSRRLYRDQSSTGVDDPKTRPMFGASPPELPPRTVEKEEGVSGQLRSTQVIGEAGARTSRAAREAIDAVVEAAESSEAEVLEEMVDAEDPADAERRQAEDSIDTQIIPVEAMELGGEESSEPIVLLSEEKEPLDEAGSLEERIAELNRRRQAYMKEQEWKKLAALYEEGIDLFSDADERRQVFLSLGMIYETKLEEEESAFDAYLRAWGEKDASSGQAKTFASVLRMGLGMGLEGRFSKWIDDELEPALGSSGDEGGRQLLGHPGIRHLLEELQSRDLSAATVKVIDTFLTEQES